MKEMETRLTCDRCSEKAAHVSSEFALVPGWSEVEFRTFEERVMFEQDRKTPSGEHDFCKACTLELLAFIDTKPTSSWLEPGSCDRCSSLIEWSTIKLEGHDVDRLCYVCKGCVDRFVEWASNPKAKI